MDENVRIAVAMRTVRAALGMNQQEFAVLLGIAKSTVARVETLELSLKADAHLRMMRIASDLGVQLDTMYSDDIVIRIKPEALLEAQKRLADETQRRADRKQSRLRTRRRKLSPLFYKEDGDGQEDAGEEDT